MGITKNSNEYELWKEVYTLRNKYSGIVKDEESLKQIVDETNKLFEKYEDTDAHIPALWCCMAIREMFNEELAQKHWH